MLSTDDLHRVRQCFEYAELGFPPAFWFWLGLAAGMAVLIVLRRVWDR